MTKKQLKEKGLTEEQADTVLEMVDTAIKEYIKTEGYIPKSRFDELNEAKKSAEATVKERDKQIEDLKEAAKGSDELQEQIEKLTADNTAAAQEYDRKIKTYSLKDALKSAGANDPDYVIYKMGGVEKFSFNDDGSVFGLDDTLKTFKEQNPHQFIPQGGGNPRGGTNPAADPNKMSYKELCEYLESNPGAKLE